MSPFFCAYLPALVLGALALVAALGFEGRGLIVAALIVLSAAVVVHTRELVRRYQRVRTRPYRPQRR